MKLIIGMDECGRGALAGPVAVGVAVADLTVDPPAGLTDSKALTSRRRESLLPDIDAWTIASAVGYASNVEVDTYGIMPALRAAGERALHTICRAHPEFMALTCVVDGNINLVGKPDRLGDDVDSRYNGDSLDVVTVVKADLTVPAVSAASIIAKQTRDRLMADLAGEHPGYGWDGNAGYGTPSHMAAIAENGATPLHRTTWLKQ